MILMNIHIRGYMINKWKIGHIEPFWDDEYRFLNYRKELFNNPEDLKKWREQGYIQPVEFFTGMMCKHGENQPSWTNKIIEWLENDYNWSDIGVNYYRMETGVILPPHKDMYVQYSKMFNCTLDEIERVLLFMEDWKGGHYFEVDGNPIMDYKAGDYAYWKGKVEHAASNIGKDYRYTLQLTGHVK